MRWSLYPEAFSRHEIWRHNSVNKSQVLDPVSAPKRKPSPHSCLSVGQLQRSRLPRRAGSLYGSALAQHQVQHQAPHTPRHAACRTGMWWVVRNSSIQSLDYRNGTSPLAPPTYIAGFSSYLDVQAGASPHWVHCVLLGSLLTTVAVQPGRCRRFIGTLLARTRFAPRTLRMVQRTRSSEEMKVTPLILGTTMGSCGK